MVHPQPFLTSHLETPKDIAKKRSTVQDIALPSFKPSRRSVSPSPKYVSWDKKKQVTTDDIYPTKRILAFVEQEVKVN